MRKVATGLTSVPMSNVPGSENSEIDFMEPEDAEAANSGGFNQMEVGSFAKDLELVKQQRKLKKKASEIFTDLDAVVNSASKFGAKVTSEDPEEIFESFLKDIVLKTDVYWGPPELPAMALSTDIKKIVKYWKDNWISNSKITTTNSYEDFLANNLDTDFLETLGTSVGSGAVAGGAIGAAVGGIPTAGIGAIPGLGIGGAIGGAVGAVGGLFAQWNDEVIEQIEDFYNVLVDYKLSFNKKKSGISDLIGIELIDVSGDYSYKIISDNEIEIVKSSNGAITNVTPDNAAENNIDWTKMISDLKDPSKTIKKSANFNFNIAKVSKNMRKELVKLNSALNGLGYNNLIKTAIRKQDFTVGKLYIHDTETYAIRCINTSFSGFTELWASVKIIWTSDEGGNVTVTNEATNLGTSEHLLGDTYDLEDNEPDEWTETTIEELKSKGGKILNSELKSQQASIPKPSVDVGLSMTAEMTDVKNSGLINNIYRLDTGAVVGFYGANTIKLMRSDGAKPEQYDAVNNQTDFKKILDIVKADTNKKIIGNY